MPEMQEHYLANKSDHTHGQKHISESDQRRATDDSLAFSFAVLRYAPRGPAYVASLYRDDPREDEDDACVCGYTDGLHVHDASCGWVAKRSAQDFAGYAHTNFELDPLSCDALKSHAVDGPAVWRHEVDLLPASRRPPPHNYNTLGGRGQGLEFDAWIVEKERSMVQQEAERKRRAIGELSAQIARRVQAVKAFDRWKTEKNKSMRSTTPATAQSTEEDLTPRTLAATTAEKAARRNALFNLWRSEKDSLRLATIAAEKERAAAEQHRLDRERAEALAKGSEAFSKWVPQATQKLEDARQKLAAASAAKQKAAQELKANRAAKSAEQLAEWTKAKQRILARNREEQQAQRAKTKEAREKRRKEVADTQTTREQQISARLTKLQQERTAKEKAERRARKAEHKSTWAKKDAAIVPAYSTLQSEAHVFR